MHKRCRALHFDAHMYALKLYWGLESVKKIVAKQEACMGCGLCEVYCTVAHSKSKDAIKAYNSERPKSISRIRREVNKPVSFAIQCRNCDDAPCVSACLAAAMTKDSMTG